MESPETGFVAWAAESIGTCPASLRLMLSLFSGYPLALFHRYVLSGKAPDLQHIYFVITGLALGYFNFGHRKIYKVMGDNIWATPEVFNNVHPRLGAPMTMLATVGGLDKIISGPHVFNTVVNILMIYILLLVAGGTITSIILSFLINMTYILVGYYTNMTGDYNIAWTTPHCVLTLRLIALTFDVYDGQRKTESLSAEQKETALHKLPSLLEISGQVYFFGGFLVGPLYSMKRYLDFTKGAYSDSVTGGRPNCVTPALLRLLAAIFYAFVCQIGLYYIPENYPLQPSFQELSYINKLLVVALYSKVVLHKYLTCWLLAEGCCILVGLTYSGKDENGNELWDGCANIHIRQYEMASSAREIIQSFNVNTNRWMAKYIFKRLKFLGVREVSQAVTLAFLAVWHGLYSGYLITFSIEFFLLKFETETSPLLGKTALVQALRSSRPGLVVLWALKKLYAQFILGYALIAFCLFTYDKYWQVYRSIYFVLHIFLLAWLLIRPQLTRSRRKPTSNNERAGVVDVPLLTKEE